MGDPTRTLIELREGVHLYGGFIGTEVRLEQQNESFKTIIAGAARSESDEGTALIVGASNTILSGFKVLGHNEAVLVLQDAQDFRVSNVTIESVSSRRESHLQVLNSTGVFESLELRKQSSIAADRVAGIEIRQSRVRLRDCEFVGLEATYSSFAAAPFVHCGIRSPERGPLRGSDSAADPAWTQPTACGTSMRVSGACGGASEGSSGRLCLFTSGSLLLGDALRHRVGSCSRFRRSLGGGTRFLLGHCLLEPPGCRSLGQLCLDAARSGLCFCFCF